MAGTERRKFWASSVLVGSVRRWVVAARGFDMRVLVHDPMLKDVIAKTEGVEYAELVDLLAQSDFVTIHTLWNESTRHLINAGSLEK